MGLLECRRARAVRSLRAEGPHGLLSYDYFCMVILLFPILIVVLAAPLIYLGVSIPLSLVISFVVGAIIMWFIVRAYKRAKHKLDNQWRG